MTRGADGGAAHNVLQTNVCMTSSVLINFGKALFLQKKSRIRQLASTNV
jgi:hypothetical protein